MGPHPMSFRMKVYRQGKEMLVAASDEHLIGRKLSEGVLRLDVKEAFYGTELGDEALLLQYLKVCTIANLVGAGPVGIAVKAGYVDLEAVMLIEGVPHAQLARMV